MVVLLLKWSSRGFYEVCHFINDFRDCSCRNDYKHRASSRETENTLFLKKATKSAGLTQLRIIKRTKRNSKKYSVESGSSKSVAVVNDVVSQVRLEKGTSR